MSYTAVIVEPRKHKALHFVVNNILTNLSEAWNVIIFHGTINEQFCKDFIESFDEQKKNRISLRNLGTHNLSIEDYNRLLTSKSFYESIPTEIILVFQADTMIFNKNKDAINNFMIYDYVGAPWSELYLGNGGFSLRRKAKMMEIIDSKPYNNENEDIFFCVNTQINKPTFEEAKQFSIEKFFSPQSFGCHKPWKNGNDAKLFVTYPEVKDLYLLNGVPI